MWKCLELAWWEYRMGVVGVLVGWEGIFQLVLWTVSMWGGRKILTIWVTKVLGHDLEYMGSKREYRVTYTKVADRC